MATFEYVEIPADVVRLKPASLEPAAKIVTSLPDTARTSSPWRATVEPLSPAKSALALVPQMLLSASIPASAVPLTSTITSAIASPDPRAAPDTLLSTRDPLSLPIMTANFRRFVSKVGPVFWLQDRVEEVVLWKKGWKRTTAWLAAYGFFCYFPRMTLLIPHILLLGVMLHCYPDPGAQPAPISVGEGTADWQANIQAIQNLMGAFSDVHDAVLPLLPFLVAPHLASSVPKSYSKSSSIATSTLASPLEPVSPPTPTQPHHALLIVTLATFFLLLPILMTDLLPLRLLSFLSGAGGVCALHPRVRSFLSVVSTALSGAGPGISFQLSICVPRLPNPLSFLVHRSPCSSPPPPRIRTFAFTIAPRDIYLFLRQLVDNDRLEDTVWRAPLTQVELWENERWVQAAPETKRRKSLVTLVRDGEEEDGEDDGASTISTATVLGLVADGSKGSEAGGTWSKTNLRPNERVGWTRGRDGWSGVGGEVSSNLTFSLSPGWAFVETESWRPDLTAAWVVEGGDAAASASVCVGADEDGWTYTTDTWTHPRPDGRPCDGWVTRRRRWVRRIYLKEAAR